MSVSNVVMMSKSNRHEPLANAFRDHHRRVFKAAFRITGSASDAEDVLQSVFLRILKRGDASERLDLGRDPASYLCRAAINAGLDVLRSRKRAPSTDLAQVPEPLGDEVSIADEVEQVKLRTRLRAALSVLDPRAAEVIALRYFEGYGNVEIADMLDTSASVIAVTLHRARQRLKAELGVLEELNHE